LRNAVVMKRLRRRGKFRAQNAVKTEEHTVRPRHRYRERDREIYAMKKTRERRQQWCRRLPKIRPGF